MRILVLALLTTALATVQSGCTASQGLGGRLGRLLPPANTAEPGTDGSSDPWIAEAAAEGRREHAVEKVNDPLGLRKYYMSDRAREIERNCGIVE